jgi:hypothetical protein
VIGFSLPSNDVSGVYYFASSMGVSAAGSAMAAAVASGLGVEPVGRSIPLLRETRAPAIVVVLPRLDPAAGRAVTRGVESWLSRTRHEDQDGVTETSFEA